MFWRQETGVVQRANRYQRRSCTLLVTCLGASLRIDGKTFSVSASGETVGDVPGFVLKLSPGASCLLRIVEQITEAFLRGLEGHAA